MLQYYTNNKISNNVHINFKTKNTYNDVNVDNKYDDNFL